MRKRIMALLLAFMLAFGLLPMSAGATQEAAEYTPIANLEGLAVSTLTDAPWTLEEEVFTSAGQGTAEGFTTLKVEAAAEGLLKFSWTISSAENAAFFAYRSGEDYTQPQEITGQEEKVFTGEGEGEETGIPVKAGDVVYLTYYRTAEARADETITDQAAISNLRIEAAEADLTAEPEEPSAEPEEPSAEEPPAEEPSVEQSSEEETTTQAEEPSSEEPPAEENAEAPEVQSPMAAAQAPMGLMAATPDASTDGTDGYEQIQITESDYSLYTKSDYPWTGSGTYTSGNAGAKNTISTLKLVANKAGLLKFDWTVSYVNRLAYFAYRVGEDYTTVASVTSQSEHKYSGQSVGSESGILVAEGDVIYFTYAKINANSSDTTVDDVASISNVRIEDYVEPDPIDLEELIVYDGEKGTVTAQIMERLKDPSDIEYTHLSDVDMADVAEGNTYRLKAVAKPGYQFYGWVQTYMYNGQVKQSFRGLRYYTLIEKTVTDDNGNITRIVNDQQAITVPELEVNLDGKSRYDAIFAPEGSYIARVNATFYDNSHNLADIINSASSGDMIEILGDATLSSDATVKKGATLYVPFRPIVGADDESAGKYRKCGGKANEFGGTAYLTMTVSSGTTLTVNGKLALGAVTGAATQGMQGHISGAYGQIVNDGSIIISQNGTMITYGLVTGSGIVKAENYGIVKEPLVICDFAGGSNTLALYTDQQMPFKRFATQNIQCELQLERYGTLTGMINLYAIGGFNEVEADVVGVTSQSIFWPNDTGVSGSDIILSRTYTPEYLASGTGQSSGIGKTTWNVYGGLVFRNLTLNLGIATVSMDHVDFAIPPHMDFIMNDGLYDIPGKVKIMPGAHMTVASDATLKISGKLIVLDGLRQEAMSGYKYPTREQLSVPGYGGSGEFVLNGTLRITEGSTLGGVIQSTANTGVLIIEEGTYLKNSTADLGALDPAAAVDLDVSLARQIIPETDTWAVEVIPDDGYSVFYNWVQQDGGKGGYADNTTWFNLPARVYNGTEMVELTPGTWKSSEGSYTFTDTSHQRYCSNGKSVTSAAYTNAREMTLYDDTFERTVQGVWGESSSAVEITSNTVAGSDKAGSLTNGVTMDAVTVRNSDGSTTLTLKAMKGDAPATGKYVSLVKYVTATGTLTAEGTNGVYTIPAEGLSVTIESALLGDVNGDGDIAVSDISAIRLHILGKRLLKELPLLAADANGNAEIAVSDISSIRLHILGKRSLF